MTDLINLNKQPVSLPAFANGQVEIGHGGPLDSPISLPVNRLLVWPPKMTALLSVTASTARKARCKPRYLSCFHGLGLKWLPVW